MNALAARQHNAQAPPLPHHRLHCRHGHYGRILGEADHAGMLRWSLVSDESSSYRTMANTLTMTSFGVRKVDHCDRLTSWPRVQNALMDDPPTSNCRTRELLGSSVSLLATPLRRSSLILRTCFTTSGCRPIWRPCSSSVPLPSETSQGPFSANSHASGARSPLKGTSSVRCKRRSP